MEGFVLHILQSGNKDRTRRQYQDGGVQVQSASSPLLQKDLKNRWLMRESVPLFETREDLIYFIEKKKHFSDMGMCPALFSTEKARDC